MKKPVIPTFALYGETATPGQEMLHIEEVQSRSRLYHWEIEPHVHHGLYQVLWVQQGAAEVVLDEWREAVHGPAAIVAGWLARAVVWRLAQARAQGLQTQGERAHRHQALFTRFLLLVEQHFLAHWPLERYASRLGLSTPRLNRLVRAERGCSALELVHERLTREACRRLIYIAAPAASLATELGFEDPAYFSRFFKRRTGMSPHRYRQAHSAQD